MISVVIPVKNAKDFIVESVESVLKQRGVKFEIILIDDGSTDGSLTILKDLQNKNANVHVLNSPGQGLVDALNYGILNAKGDYVARLDADDKMAADRLVIQSNYLNENVTVAVVGSQLSFLNSDGNTVTGFSRYPCDSNLLAKKIVEGCFLAHPSVMFRKSLIQNLGGYRKQFTHAEDYDLWLRVSQYFDLANIDLPLTYYRQHPNQVSVRKRHEQEIATRAAQLSHLIRIGKINLESDMPISHESLNNWVDFVEVKLISKKRFSGKIFLNKSKASIYWTNASLEKEGLQKFRLVFLAFLCSPFYIMNNLRFFVISRARNLMYGKRSRPRL